MNSVKLPYFDYLLKKLAEGDEVLEKTFGRHVHWGYWEDPANAVSSVPEFAKAAEELSKQLCLSAPLNDGMALLDVGCGFGGTIAHINENYQDMRLYGVNLDGRQLSRARELVTPVGKNAIVFSQGNASKLPFGDQSFDAVLAVECIFHFPSRKQFFNEAFRVLKPGGCLVLSDFVCSPIIQPFAKLRLPKMLGIGFYGQCNLQFSVRDYKNLAAETGFRIKTERDINDKTLPTYRFLRFLSQTHRPDNPFAMLETVAAESLSSAGLLNYYLFGFAK